MKRCFEIGKDTRALVNSAHFNIVRNEDVRYRIGNAFFLDNAHLLINFRLCAIEMCVIVYNIDLLCAVRKVRRSVCVLSRRVLLEFVLSGYVIWKCVPSR